MVREKLYHRGILVLFIEICKKQVNIEECFFGFMKLLKLIAKENNSLYETGSYIYAFIMSQFKMIADRGSLKIEVSQKVLHYLIDIALETDFDMTQMHRQFLICDQSALEAYLHILVLCFKNLNKESNQHLLLYVLTPLEALSKSFMNNYILSQINAQDLLMKMLKRSTIKDFQKQISRHIGRINSTHTSSQHIQTLMRHFAKKSKYVIKETTYFSSLLDILIDSISGDSIRNVYFFSTKGKSFIQLKTPLVCTSLGLFWTGYIRYEEPGVNERQCIFSFLKERLGEIKGVELYIEKRKLIYRLVKLAKIDNSLYYPLNTVDIAEDSWHHITMLHIGNELQLYIDGYFCSLMIAGDVFSKEYDYATIGAATDPLSDKKLCTFFGEMSSLYFFSPTPKAKDVIKELADSDQSSLTLLKAENLIGNILMIKNQNTTQKEKKILFDIQFILEPKVIRSNKLDECIW